MVSDNIELASLVNGGFSTTFIVPQTIDGNTYSISIIDKRELIVVYNEFEYVEFLQTNVSGELQFGENILSKNESGKLSLNG